MRVMLARSRSLSLTVLARSSPVPASPAQIRQRQTLVRAAGQPRGTQLARRQQQQQQQQQRALAMHMVESDGAKPWPAPPGSLEAHNLLGSAMLVPWEVRVISEAKGTGLCTTAPISKGELIFRETDVIEHSYTREEALAMLEPLSVPERRRILHHSYCTGGRFQWCRDVVALMNHDQTPNVGGTGEHVRAGDPATCFTALRDISAGEELVLDYAESIEQGEEEWFKQFFPQLIGEPYPHHSLLRGE
eukprot:NODE_2195_length_978_cov_311.617551.p1 GENE.NODE_2195_length_978_cov_311.617551~~NODE_2195_length_978_cov_311.617551.p1  ORF type:complete len:247 (-),score=48.60 NODE_2195_length_978_cov_311.617551:172-912(-)